MSLFAMELSSELESIRHFLEQNLKGIESEISEIDRNWDESQAETPDDYGNLMYRPMKREEITLRATYYELNAMIEHHMRSFAQEAYQKSAKHASVPKSILNVPEDELHRTKFIEDLPMGEVKRLIERYYKFSLDQIPEYSEVCQIRETANSFKHHRGFKDFRRDPKAGLTERHKLERDRTRQAIGHSRNFLLALYHKVTRSDNHYSVSL